MRSAIFSLLTIAFFSPIHGEEEHWAYRAPVLPEGLQAASGNPIDMLLESARKKSGIEAAALAPPADWIRRASYTLTGLPATAEQIKRISENPDEKTWLSLIDELLANPAYGERWARHWMDVARYADTLGYNFDKDNRYPFAYTYRDWLIKSFNSDLPYAEFIKLQIAADQLTKNPNDPNLAALGFLTVGPRSGNLETIDDRVDVVSRGFLSTTVSCARCHKHKFDPITMDDYYSFYSIFANTEEPDQLPVIGKPVDETAYAAFQQELKKRQDEDLAARQAIVDQIRNPESSSVYLELAWLAITENWDSSKISSEAFKRGRYRLKAVEKWRDFLKTTAYGEKPTQRLAQWQHEMASADDAGRKKLSLQLATEWFTAPADSELAKLARDNRSPLSFDADRISGIFDQDDGNASRTRAGELAKLQIDHPGSPPRAMSLTDRKNLSPAKIYKRGDPSNPGEIIERQWLSFLGGEKYTKDKSPRLSLAEKIADQSNPLTSRVMVNRVWAWHMGSPIADPGDFGTQQPSPVLLSLLDALAIHFNESGGSLKDLHRLILTSKAFRLSADGPVKNSTIDEGNTLYWKWNRQRVDFESMRDRLLSTSGTLETKNVGGKSVIIDDISSDSRRSVYSFIDRYALATTFVSFDLPHPDHHAPKRIETTVPQQSLYLLNSPLLLRQAEQLAKNPELLALPDDNTKVNWIYQRIFRRAPSSAESREVIKWLSQSNPADYEPRLAGFWEVRHAPVVDGKISGELKEFPLFKDKTWRTGPEFATAPIPWLHVGAESGHAHKDHAIIIRWRALGPGEVRMVGMLKRNLETGDTLEWNLSVNNSPQESHELPFKSNSKIEGPWTKVSRGDTVDMVVRAPKGHSYGGVNWNIRMLGRETPGDKPVELNNFTKQFPVSNSPSPEAKPASPWADLIQMLWASNEFQFIE